MELASTQEEDVETLWTVPGLASCGPAGAWPKVKRSGTRQTAAVKKPAPATLRPAKNPLVHPLATAGTLLSSCAFLLQAQLPSYKRPQWRLLSGPLRGMSMFYFDQRLLKDACVFPSGDAGLEYCRGSNSGLDLARVQQSARRSRPLPPGPSPLTTDGRFCPAPFALTAEP